MNYKTRFFLFTLSLSALLTLSSLAAPTSSNTTSYKARPINILCIGDSITQGGRLPDEFTYRYPLQQLLAKQHRSVNFIGSRSKGLNESFTWPSDFDPDHEGYYGAKTAEVAQFLQKSLLNLEKPDIAIIHLGTNDTGSQQTIFEPLTDIIKQLRDKNPRVKILLMGLPDGESFNRNIYILNAALIHSTKASPITVIPLQIGWNYQQDTFDGAHPNLVGQAKMAALIDKQIELEIKN